MYYDRNVGESPARPVTSLPTTTFYPLLQFPPPPSTVHAPATCTYNLLSITYPKYFCNNLICQ